ncbi:MAG TPA: S41 family peptidase [Gemmatales bacterium]|nr:S41 family peptidase [Gemmatales bacterium]
MKNIAACFVTILLMLLVERAFAEPPHPIPEARALMGEKKYADAAKKLEAYLATNRFDGRAWSSYSECLHMTKQYHQAIEAANKAIETGFNLSGQMYNIACGYALLGKKEEAIAWLKKALDKGFAEQETLEKDDDLDSLRDDPRFIQLTGLKPPSGLSSSKQWEWDLDFMARRMEQMHWNLYAKVTKETFLREIENLKADTGKLSSDRIRVRLSRILAMVGDGHTTLATFAEGEKSVARIPLHLRVFTDGLFVIGTPKSQLELLGARVTRVGQLDVDEAMKRLRSYCSVDNDMGYLDSVPRRLMQLAALQEIGATTDEDVEFTFLFPNHSTRTVKIALEPASPAMTRRAQRPGYIYANSTSKVPTPLYLRDVDQPLTLENLDEAKAIYFGFHAVGESKGQRFSEFVDLMLKRIEEKNADYLIIDMRLNGGGNTGLVRPLIDALIKNDRINRPGHLYVIIGRETFSAAQNTVNLIESNTHATFVGEPTGSRPNFVGESTYLILPYSKLRVYCSSRYWQHVTSTDQRNWVPPQIAAELSYGDFNENRDPCLAAILERIKIK